MRLHPVFMALLRAVVALWGTGCVRSIQPVLKPEQYITEPSIVGKWVTVDGHESAEITAQVEPSKAYDVLYIEKEKKGSPLEMNLGTVGKLVVLELSPQDRSLDQFGDLYKLHMIGAHTFHILQEHSDKRLVLKSMSPKWLKDYLKTHPGELDTVNLASDAEDVLISGSTDQIQAFLQAHSEDKEAWDSRAIFVRPGDPTTQPSSTQPAETK